MACLYIVPLGSPDGIAAPLFLKSNVMCPQQTPKGF